MTEPGETPRGRDWLRAGALLVLALALAPVGPLALLTVPLALLGAAMGGWRGVFLAVPALYLAWGMGPEPGLWFLERGWALLAGAWFLALTLRWPDAALAARGIGAVAAAAATAGVLLVATPGGWTVAEWAVRGRLEQGAAAAAEVMRRLGTESGAGAPEETLLRLVEMQLFVLPALLALSTVAALALGWWVLVRSTTGRRDVLKPVAEFRFPDPLVWVLIGGSLLLLVGMEPWVRVGANALVFMAPLYALRGAGVVMGVQKGFSPLGWMLLGLGLLLAAPALLVGAFLVGLGDTWIDLRARASRPAR